MSVDVTQDLLDTFRSSIPADVTSAPFARDLAYSQAVIMTAVEAEISRLVSGSRISSATGLFLSLHAVDHGLRRQGSENDDQLRPRLQRPPQAVTPEAILYAVQLIVDAASTGLQCRLVELPLSGAYYDSYNFYDEPNTFYGGGHGVVIVIIPAAANSLTSVTDAVRSKVSAGKIWFVLEYTSP